MYVKLSCYTNVDHVRYSNINQARMKFRASTCVYQIRHIFLWDQIKNETTIKNICNSIGQSIRYVWFFLSNELHNRNLPSDNSRWYLDQGE